MKYPAHTRIIGHFESGDTVTIKLIATATDSLVPLDSNACTPFTDAPDWFYFSTENITTYPAIETEYLAVMTNGSDEFGNKLVLRIEDTQDILDSINALNDLSLSQVEGSAILAKEASLSSIASAIALIPTTDSVADLTPVLTALGNLNDVSAAEVRAAFNEADFKDKNTEAEIHAWLDSYENKADWKASSVNLTPVLDAISALNNLSLSQIEGSSILAKGASVQLVQTTIDALNNVSATEVRAAFDENDFKDKNTEGEIHSWLDSYSNKDTFKATTTALQTLLQSLYDGSSSGGMRKDYPNNQIVILKRDGTDGDVFDCYDVYGNPSLVNIARMELV